MGFEPTDPLRATAFQGGHNRPLCQVCGLKFSQYVKDQGAVGQRIELWKLLYSADFKSVSSSMPVAYLMYLYNIYYEVFLSY